MKIKDVVDFVERGRNAQGAADAIIATDALTRGTTAERPLGNGKSIYLYPIIFGARVAIAASGEPNSFDDVW